MERACDVAIAGRNAALAEIKSTYLRH